MFWSFRVTHSSAPPRKKDPVGEDHAEHSVGAEGGDHILDEGEVVVAPREAAVAVAGPAVGLARELVALVLEGEGRVGQDAVKVMSPWPPGRR